MNTGYADNFWGHTPKCLYGEYNETPDIIEAGFAAFGREIMLANMQRDLDAQEWAEVQPNIEAWARQWFWELARLEEKYSGLPVSYLPEELDEWAEHYCDFSQIDW